MRIALPAALLALLTAPCLAQMFEDVDRPTPEAAAERDRDDARPAAEPAIHVPRQHHTAAETPARPQVQIPRRSRVTEADRQRRITTRLRDLIDHVLIEDAAARDAFTWWARTTGINLVVNWRRLEEQGIDPEKSISLNLRNVPAGQALSLLMSQATEEGIELMYEITPWYVQITTKREANTRNVTRIYDIRELLHEVPNFDDAPDMDLESALSADFEGGGGDVGLFGGGDDAAVQTKTKQEKGEEIAQLIREVIEPEIWGLSASIRYFDGRLIVSAPQYVHEQIGLPAVRATPRPTVTAPREQEAPRTLNREQRNRRSKVAGVRGE